MLRMRRRRFIGIDVAWYGKRDVLGVGKWEGRKMVGNELILGSRIVLSEGR